MDNGDEVRQLIKLESDKILKESFKDAKQEHKLYNLADEFSKTKANRSFRVVGISSLILVAVAAFAFISVRIIETRSRNVKIDIQSFQDVNLRDILDVAKKNSNDLE